MKLELRLEPRIPALMSALTQTLRVALSLMCATLCISGCAGQGRSLMPTPTLYSTLNARHAFDQVPETLRNPSLDLLYFTNRIPDASSKRELTYGSERSTSLAFGSVHVDIGPGLTWPELVDASQSAERRVPVKLEVVSTHEFGRYPPSPYVIRDVGSGFVRDPGVMAEHDKAEQTLGAELKRHLARTPKKEIVLYVHGFNESFEEASFVAAELCHFLGREHLCALFSWPAGGGGGLVRAYSRDRESGEFSVAPLKKAIRSIAGVPGIEKIHLLAHSRGADVLLQAVQALMLEAYVFGEAPGDVLKIENLILVAADVDAHVFLRYLTLYASDPEMPSRWGKSELPSPFRETGRMTIYTSDADRALWASTALFRSVRRLGRLRAEDLTDHMRKFLAESGFIDIVEVPRERVDFFGHGYYTNHPAVSSDLVARIRYGLNPGDSGRALRPVAPPMVWAID